MDRATKTQRILESLARWLVTAAVVLAPWLFGSTDPWAYLLISGLVGSGGIIWLFALVCSPAPRIRIPGMTALLLGLIAYAAIQGSPMPASITKVFNKISYTVTDPARSVLAQVATATTPTPAAAPNIIPSSLSISLPATRSSIGLMIACVLAFLVLVNTSRGWSDINRAAGVVVVSAFIMAVLGMVHKLSGSQEIFWFHTPRFGGNVFGPFTNRNHFAAYINMALGLVLGLFLTSRPLGQAGAGMDWRERLAWFSSRGASRSLLAAFAVVIMGAAVCMSLSRGAILSLALTLGGLCLLLGRAHPALAKARATLIAVSVAMIALMLILGVREIVQRMGSLKEVASNPFADMRFIVTRDSLGIIADAPLLGTGFGTFRHVYTMYQTPPLTLRWLHAHNDWVQLFVEAGLLGAGLFIAAILAGLLVVRRRLTDTADTPRLMLLGISVSLGTIAFHSFIDYGLHKPANTLMLAFCAALGIAAVHLRRTSPTPAASRTQPVAAALRAVDSRPLPPGLLRVLALVALAGLVWLLPLRMRELRGQLAFSRFLYLKRLTEKVSTSEELARTVSGARSEAMLVNAFARYDADALAELTSALLRWSGDATLDRGERAALSQQAASLAFWSVCAAPSDYLPWLSLARTQMSLGHWDEADLCLQRARELVRHPADVKMFEILRHRESDAAERQIP